MEDDLMKKRLAIVSVIIMGIFLMGGRRYLFKKNSEPQIGILEVVKDEQTESYKNLYTESGNQIHFSVDDVLESLVNLTIDEHDSVFDEEHFAFLRELHDKYGLKISAYVFFENSDYDLTDISRDYIEEFKDNSDWLSFGFHSLNKETNYKNATASQAENDYNKVISELIEIVGEESIDRTVRLHNYAASEQAVNGFRNANLGIEILLSPEDRRLAYNLDEEDTSYLYLYDYFHNGDVEYIKTDLRLEKLDNVDEFYNEFIYERELNQIFVVFTHEPYLVNQEIQQKTHELIKLFDDYSPADF